ncbi:hypothetical protein CYMTET_10814 [Cymbomonas tetramitiformis]|uniref:Uncharacterized protein n=1 Tax=Cymbomonas tetramitiformis TaxID=36881 RepID=A0AAE0GNG0_9CHLO|nr:hypothetical protein CYMTET_10814 [Cymbomonas tetramitiformis]
MCSNSSESDVQSLCHDANLLSAEQMAQAATFCGFSFVAESVRPTHARTVCRSLPYGFVHRCNATEQKTYSWSQRDGTDDAARTDYVYHAIAAPSDPVNTTDMHDADNKMVILNGTILDSAELDDFRTNDRKLVAVCSRAIPRNLSRSVLVDTDGGTDTRQDGVSELSERRLREAREAIADFKTHVAKCALNALNTFPFLDSDDSHGFASLYANSRANSLERILSPRLNGSGGTPWPYPWTKRGPLKNMSRVTIGAVLQKGTSGHGYAQLSSVGPVSERVEVEGVGATVGVDAPGRLRHDARGNSQGGHRRDPVLFETDLAFAFARDDSKAFGTSLRSQLSQVTFGIERCEDEDTSRRALFRIRSLADNRFLKTKGAGSHPNLPSAFANITQHPRFSRTQRYQADPGLHHERYHTNGTFEAAARPAFTNATADDAYEGLDPATRRSSTVYLVEKHDQSFLMRDSSAGHASNATRLYDFGGYLFESDVHLTHGARDDLHDHDDGESVAGDFDSSGNVGTYGLSTRKNEYLPLKDVSATTELDWADEVRTFNRQLFFVVGKSDTPISFCTTGGDDTSDTFSTRHTRPSPHDSKLDSKMCTEMNQRRYSNWASDYPMHGATLGKEATDAILGAGTFDCAAINVLSGSHCALYKDDEGGCLLGHDAKYAQWVTLPCSQRKPFVCGNGELMKAIVTPMGFDEARAHCILEFGSDYDLVSPPSNKIENSDLATTARDALCAAEKLQPYATEGDDICNRYPDVTHAEKHTEQTLAELIDSSCMKRDLLLRKYHCCDTTSAYLYVYAENSTEKTLVRNHVGVAGATHFTCEDPIRPGSHARGSFYANGDTITAGDEASYGDAWNLQYGSVWMGMRRHGRLRRFSDQRIGKCDLRGSDSVAEAMLFEIVPCKDDSDSHVSGEYAIVGRDPTGRSVLLAVHEASHPFDAEALGTEAATRNAEAFIHAVDKNRTLLNPSSIESATDLLSSYETLFENHLEHPLRPSVWRTRATTLKMLESGYRRGVTMDNARSGRCVQSEARPDRQLHGVSIVTCNVEQHCGTIQFDVNAAVKLNFVMIPTDGESTGDLMQTLASDLSLDRPVMHSRWRTSSTRRRLIAQTSDASGLFGWTKSMNETLFTDAYRRNESALSDGGVTKPFATKSTYGTRGAADSALDPGDRMRSKVFGGPHVAAEASDDIFSVGRGVVDMKTYFHTLNVSTYPCEGTHYLDASFPYDAHTCASLVDHLPAPRIKEVYTPSTCGVDSYESDERCTLLSLLTGRRLGFVEGIHARPSSSQPVLLERLDALWDAAEDDEDHELFSESTTAEHLKTIAQRSNRKSLWYPILHDDRDNMEAQRQMTSLDEVHSNGWLYTCAGKTLAFEPAINLGNPPAPNSPPSEFLSSNENTNIGKFQVTAGGVLIQVNITGNARVRRDIAEAYTVSNAQSSVRNFQRSVDTHQAYRPNSAYNTYSFSGVEALSATVEYGAAERAEETQSACGDDYHTCKRYLNRLYKEGELSNTDAVDQYRVLQGAKTFAHQDASVDDHYVGGPRLQLPSEYTYRWSPPVGNSNKEGLNVWIKGHSFNETGTCSPSDETHAYSYSCDDESGICTSRIDPPVEMCVQRRSVYKESAAHDHCHNSRSEGCQNDDAGFSADPVIQQLSSTEIKWSNMLFCDQAVTFTRFESEANSLYNFDDDDTSFVCNLDNIDMCADKANYVSDISDSDYENLKGKCENLVRAVSYYCPQMCDACEQRSWLYEARGRLQLRDANDTYEHDKNGVTPHHLCTCTETSPDLHCRPISVKEPEEYQTVTEEVRTRPEAVFMERFMTMWNSTADPSNDALNKVLPVVDMWNDVGAHGGVKYDTAFLYNNFGKGWKHDAGNFGPGRILVTFPYNNEHGDTLNYEPELYDEINVEAYSRSEKRLYGYDLEHMADFNNKETFKKVSDLIADLCDNITHAYRRFDSDSAAERMYAQPCMGFSAQDMYVYDGAPYDLDSMTASDCMKQNMKGCEEHRYQMMSSHYYPNYQDWRHHRSEKRAWSKTRDGLFYALEETTRQNPEGLYSSFVYDANDEQHSSQESLYTRSSEFENAFAVNEETDINGRGAIRAFLFTLYGKRKYATKETDVRRRERLETLRVSHAKPWTTSSNVGKDGYEYARRSRTGAPRAKHSPSVKSSYEAFLPTGSIGGVRGDAIASDDDRSSSLYTRHSGHLLATHTALDLRERYYYPAFIYKTMPDSSLDELLNHSLISEQTYDRTTSDRKVDRPIQILWPPPEVTLWTRVAEAERSRMPSREVFGPSDVPTNTFSDINGAWRLKHAPTGYKKHGVELDGCGENEACAYSGGEFLDRTTSGANQTVEVRPTALPEFGLLWNRYLRNRVPTCYREDTQGRAYFSRHNQSEDGCESLKPPLGYDDGFRGPEYMSPPSAPSPPGKPNPPPSPGVYTVMHDTVNDVKKSKYESTMQQLPVTSLQNNNNHDRIRVYYWGNDDTRTTEHIENIYETDLLPAIGYANDWRVKCSMCWATSEAFCMESRTGGEDSNGARANMFTTYGSFEKDSMSLCSKHTRKSTCEANIKTDMNIAMCTWDPYFYAESDDEELRASPGKCLGRRTVRNEYYGQPCVCEKCRGGVYCGAGGFCTCGVLPYLTLGLECQSAMTLQQEGDIQIFTRSPGDSTKPCGTCPSLGAKALSPKEAHFESVCYVRQAEFCFYRSRLSYSGIEDANPQPLSECLANLEVFGPVLCRTYCDSSVKNSMNLLYNRVSLNYSTHSNLDLYASLAMDASDIPTTEFCTCDLNLLSVYIDAVDNHEDISTLDIEVNTNTFTAQKLKTSSAEDESRRRRRLRRLLQNDSDSGRYDTDPPPRSSQPTDDASTNGTNATSGDDASTNGTNATSGDDASLNAYTREVLRTIFGATRDSKSGSSCRADADCYQVERVCAQIYSGSDAPVLCASCLKDSFVTSRAMRHCDGSARVCRCGISPTQTLHQRGGGLEIEKAQNVTLAFLANVEMWPGDSFCDVLFRDLVETNPKLNLDDIGVAEWVHVKKCMEWRMFGLRVQSALGMPTFPVDIAYNWKRPFDLIQKATIGTYVYYAVLEHNESQMNTTRVVKAFEEHGVDPIFYLTLHEKLGDLLAPVYHAVRGALQNVTAAIHSNVQTSKVVTTITNETDTLDSMRVRCDRVYRTSGLILRHVAKRDPFYHIKNVTQLVTPAMNSIWHTVKSARRAHTLASDPVHGKAFFGKVKSFYRLQYEHKWHLNSSFWESAPASDTQGTKMWRSMLQTNENAEEVSNSRTEYCDVYENIVSIVKEVSEFGAQYYGFDAATLKEMNHTLQSSVCVFLDLVQIIESDSLCRKSLYNQQRREDTRGVFTIVYDHYMLQLRDIVSWPSSVHERANDVTRTSMSETDKIDACNHITTTTFFVCVVEVVCAWANVAFDFDDDVTDTVINDVWSMSSTIDENITIEVIDNISFYDSNYEGLLYPDDPVRSESLPLGSVRYDLTGFRWPIGNWPSKPKTWRQDDDEVAYFRSWYERWKEYNFTQSDDISVLILKQVREYRDVDFYTYRKQEQNASWWNADFYERVGMMPAHIFMGMCEIRSAELETVKTDVSRWCLDANSKSVSFGPTHALMWKDMGYGPNNTAYGWFKVPFTKTSFKFDRPKQRTYGLLRKFVDYPDPLHRLVYDPQLHRAEVNAAQSDSYINKSVIARLDMHEDNFFDNSTVRREFYYCLCSDYSDDELDVCLENEACIAPKRGYFLKRNMSTPPSFVYDNGGWWDCRSTMTDADDRPCVPVPSQLLTTVANLTLKQEEFEMSTQIASSTKRSCQDTSVITCAHRNNQWPITCTFASNFIIAVMVVLILKYIFGMQNVEMYMIGSVSMLIAFHISLVKSYEWEIGCYPILPTCLFDDIASDVQTYFLPRHIHWPTTWAKRNPENNRLYDNVDCSSEPFGFSDGYRNIFYLWKRHSPKSLDSLCDRRSTSWVCTLFDAYARYYDDYDSMHTVLRYGYDNVDDLIAVYDACQLRTILNFVPAVAFTVIAVVIVIILITLLIGTAIQMFSVFLTLRTFVQYVVAYLNIKLYVLTSMVATKNHNKEHAL